MYQISQALNTSVAALTDAFLNLSSLTKGTIFHTPLGDAYFKTLKEFVPTNSKPIWQIPNHSATVIHDYAPMEIVRFVPSSGDILPNKILIVAPISGHYSTLLSDTVDRLTEDYDVYITDWKNVRDTPEIIDYDLNDYVNTLSDVFNELGHAHVLSVCQGCVPSLMALSAYPNNKVLSITLMAGPVDTRVGRTDVNKFVDDKDLEWFKDNLIHKVSNGFKSSGALVYPGQLQLAGFMSMNTDSHVKKFIDHYGALMSDDIETSDKISSFYKEYMSVMDIPGKFYLDMINDIFMDQKFIKGNALHNGSKLSASDIKCDVLVVEGELDDICGIGQTSSVQNVLDNNRFEYHLQKGVGHYGCFSGSKWRNEIANVIVSFTGKVQ